MLETTQATPGPREQEKIDSWRMFDRIAPRYDFLNRMLSFRRDVAWRKFLCRRVLHRDGVRVLDLATGTGDVLLALAGHGEGMQCGVGLDMSHNMLRRAAQKTRSARVRFMRSDAMKVAVRDDSYDAVTMAFGIRNVPDAGAVLREIRRVLVPGGRAYILEFSIPANPIFRAVYLLYFRYMLPTLGGLISGDRTAYRYLNRSVEGFPYGEAFQGLMHEAGFADLRFFPLSMGIATLYEGTNPA